MKEREKFEEEEVPRSLTAEIDALIGHRTSSYIYEAFNVIVRANGTLRLEKKRRACEIKLP